ncbi:DNA/RNA nuclease SfsA [Phreatobacter cathodiphilus]|uniref:Sugar fermentation stimulation protein homolog n=1 Tax=Phreatobacter cathodiphilus TaxID=1868589 RepID=A0A2S0NH92_9HYPH|nr:DNA/RNA nuclease SfsA [Phreatobacter cathodiphilus]AVO47293.1 DNA/RNA nuclease SfsA [Phreatobacter cathodiphilus]
MKFPTPLVPGRLIKRYKRFLADVVLNTGEAVTVHCANPGAMLGLNAPGNRVWLSRSANAARKLPLSWELVEAEFGRGPELVGINTAHPNALVEEAIGDGTIAPLAGYDRLRREVTYGRASRVDMVLTGPGRPDCYVEVKNVHLMRRPGLAEFPDSVTTRGAKHLDELGDMAEAGHRAVMVFLIQYGGAERFALARDIDPDYGRAFDRARARGVEMLAYRCRLTPEAITVERAVEMAEARAPA